MVKGLNQQLLDQLKSLRLRELYILDDEINDFSELQRTDNPRETTRKALIDQLIKQGFKVRAVITAADLGYKKPPGEAFDQTYYPAFDAMVKQQKNNFDDRNAKFKECCAVLKDTNPAARKKAIMGHFLEQNKNISSVLYFDNDAESIQAVKSLEGSGNTNPQISTFKVVATASGDWRNKEDIKANDTEECVNAQFFLDVYIKERTEEQGQTNNEYNSNWALLFSKGRDATSKIAAANKCLSLVNEKEEQPVFSDQEIEACMNGRLRNFIEATPVLKIKLSPIIQEYNSRSCLPCCF